MNDLRTLLDRAAEPSTVASPTVDADVARGRRAMRRHRVTRTAIPALAIVAVAAIGIAVAEPGTTDLPVADAEGVELLAYQGQQPSGYEVEALPDGWTIQGALPAHLTIAPAGFANQDPRDFEGKLIVALRSPDEFGTPAGDAVAVGDGTGYFRQDPFADVLVFEVDGRDVQVQVPPSLGWSVEEVVEFALGVEVTSDAVPARG